MSLTTKSIVAAILLGVASPVGAQQVDAGYSYEGLGKVIAALCQKAAYGFRAEVDDVCPKIIKKLQPQIDAEKKSAEKKEDK